MAAEVHTEGIAEILALAFRGQTQYSNYYIGLATNESLAENATLSDITEVSGPGYARQQVPANSTGFPTFEVTGANDWKIGTKQVTFTASGTWTTAKTIFLCTVASGTSGKLIASAPIDPPRTLGNGDTLQATMTITGIG